MVTAAVPELTRLSNAPELIVNCPVTLMFDAPEVIEAWPAVLEMIRFVNVELLAKQSPPVPLYSTVPVPGSNVPLDVQVPLKRSRPEFALNVPEALLVKFPAQVSTLPPS